MDSFFQKYVELSEQLCNANDYFSKSRVNQHNKALRRLAKLQKIIEQDMSPALICELFKRLLKCESDKAIINASNYCLNHGIMVDDVSEALNRIISEQKDKTLKFDAKMLLMRITIGQG